MNLKNVNNMKKLLSIVAAIFFAATTFAQVDEVTLTVIGTGVNEEQATLQALRSAIEQSFGTFVSSNTTILNDKLVQDEIVSVSNGNVKEYKKLAVATLPNKQVSISLTATVSINKLISYAKSKGSRAEFEGQTYAANVKLVRLKASSTEKAYKLLIQQLESIAKDMFTFELEIEGDPKLCNIEKIGSVYGFNCSVNIMSNIASTNFYNLYYKTTEELKLTKNEAILCSNENIKMVDISDASCNSIRRFRFDDPKTCILPISSKVFRAYQIRIGEAIYKALHRYEIQEIGNPSNSYKYVICSGCWPINITTRESNRETGKGDYQLYSTKWKEGIFSYGHYKKSFMRDFEEEYTGHTSPEEKVKKFLSKFALTEVRTPIKLSKKEQNMVKKGTYTGPTYTTSYSNPKVIKTHKISVAIPANSIERFQGFEIKY